MYQYIWDAETGGLLLTTEYQSLVRNPVPSIIKNWTFWDLTVSGIILRMTVHR